MNKRVTQALRDERGFTALETAIILMAFIVVASVFAFTVLSSGMSSTEKSKQAVLAGIEEVEGSLELKGSVIATGASNAVQTISFCIANVAGGAPIDLTTGVSKTLIIDYRDASTYSPDIDWTVAWRGYNDGDHLLEDRELAELTVTLAPTITLGANTSLMLEVKPEKGGVLPIERTTPPNIDPVMDLR